MVKLKYIFIILVFICFPHLGCSPNVKQETNVETNDTISVDTYNDKIYRYRHNILQPGIIVPFEAKNDNIIPIYDILSPANFETIIKTKDKAAYNKFMQNFMYADDYDESLLYSLVAANKLRINSAKLSVAKNLSEQLTNVYVCRHSKELTKLYIVKWQPQSATEHKTKKILAHIENFRTKDIGTMFPYKLNKYSTETEKEKAACLKGSIEYYKKLKMKMFDSDMYVFLLYYAYIMADRYDYKPAREDVVNIITRFYSEYALEPIDEDTQKFIQLFK